MLISNFDEEVARASSPLYREGDFGMSVMSAVDIVRRRLREFDRQNTTDVTPGASLRSDFARCVVATIGEIAESNENKFNGIDAAAAIGSAHLASVMLSGLLSVSSQSGA
jgi:hypothetical protein